MTDLLKTGSDWLCDTQHQHASQQVTYTRKGGTQQVVIYATLGRTEYEVNDDYTGAVSAESVDFLVRNEDLPWTPEEGDQFQMAHDDGTTCTYEVMSIPGEGHYRYCDPYHKRLRIHTKRTATA